MSTSWHRPVGAFCLSAVVALLALAPPALAAPPAAGALKINEIESSGGSGVVDYVELINNGADAAEIGGYIVKDNDDTHSFTVPAGTMIAAGGYYVADVDAGATAFGLGAMDSARVFAPGDLTTAVDSHSWTAHAVTTYGRCPNGTGAFTTTTSLDPRGRQRLRPEREDQRDRVQRRHAGRLGRADQQRRRPADIGGLRRQGQRRHAQLHGPGGHDDRGRRLLRR